MPGDIYDGRTQKPKVLPHHKEQWKKFRTSNFLFRMLSINVRNTSCCSFKLGKASLIERSLENCTSSFLDLSLLDSPSKALNLYNFYCVVLVLLVCMFVCRSVSFSTE